MNKKKRSKIIPLTWTEIDGLLFDEKNERVTMSIKVFDSIMVKLEELKRLQDEKEAQQTKANHKP